MAFGITVPKWAKTFMEYKEYLKSNHWFNLKKRVDKTHCSICYTKEKPIDVHHLWYKDLLTVKPKHLRALCRRCHYRFHDLYNKGLLSKQYNKIGVPKFRGLFKRAKKLILDEQARKN